MCISFGSEERLLTLVPPTSITSAVSFLGFLLARLARKLAPRIELVGPLENVLIGYFSAAEQVIKVPSFEVKKSGQDNPSA